jgi:hypothetical protein
MNMPQSLSGTGLTFARLTRSPGHQCRVILVALFLTSLILGAEAPIVADQDTKYDVQLVLSAKSRHRYGERIQVQVRIENHSRKALYVNPNLFDPLDAGVTVEMFDSNGRAIAPTITGHGPRPDYRGLDIVTYLREKWIRLEPGYFYGRNTTVAIVHSPKPGRYTLAAVYLSQLRSALSVAQAQALDNSGDQVLLGRLSSNKILIEILQ